MHDFESVVQRSIAGIIVSLGCSLGSPTCFSAWKLQVRSASNKENRAWTTIESEWKTLRDRRKPAMANEVDVEDIDSDVV